MNTRLFLLAIAAIYLGACSPISKSSLNKRCRATEEKFHDHTGFVLYDPVKKQTVFEYNAAKYFTPASNTKIFTLYASLKTLGDSIPALKYVQRKDSLIFWGTGDPSFLYKNVFDNGRTYQFLSSAEGQLYFSSSNFHTSHFGSGWAWDDYNTAYSSERSPFPVYGNIFTVYADKSVLKISPPYFRQFLIMGDPQEKTEIIRNVHNNDWQFHGGNRSSKVTEWDIPMKIDRETIVDLLTDTLKRPVYEATNLRPSEVKTYFSIPADSLYRVMMQDSDNFIAEQLLLLSADAVSDTLQPEIAIEFVKKNFLTDLPDDPIWVDGSGLSRYNLFTPRSIVKLWDKIYELVPQERLFLLLATGGKNGTIRNWYKADAPYIFGKTGSLSNNHCLSGYLVTKKGKTLIFSFMNNNFTASTNEIRENMQAILKDIYEKY
ncbi:MAG: D-alanyl-D-alanine carboxypeptidase/D-alanyl-D-alanine-endopeptidase [Bacteroidota bacterium]